MHRALLHSSEETKHTIFCAFISGVSYRIKCHHRTSEGIIDCALKIENQIKCLLSLVANLTVNSQVL